MVWPTQDARRQGDDCDKQLKDPSHRDAYEAEGQKQQPDHRVQNQGQQRQRPAKNQEYTPEEEFDHRATSRMPSGLIIRSTVENVPLRADCKVLILEDCEGFPSNSGRSKKSLTY
jgi:hypothetical protein